MPSAPMAHSFRRGSDESWMISVPSLPQGMGLPKGLFSGVALYTFTG